MPRRYVIKSDDMDYAPVPRLLSCLHSVCGSCCEDQFQRSGAASKVVCPVCRLSQTTKNVRTIPLDAPALKHICERVGAESMAYCSRCHDETESVAWCFECQSALCEFHAKDHNVTIDTVQHRIETFATIAKESIHIDPHLPPISCPETCVADCSAFCKTCGYLISAEAMVNHHMQHDVVKAAEIYDDARGDVLVATGNVVDREEELQGAMDHIKQVMQQLDDEADATAGSIEEEFAALKRMVEEREQSMHARLEDIKERKRKALSAQLNTLSGALESCKQASSMATAFLGDDNGEPPDAQGMYIVAARKVLVDRCNALNDDALQLALSPSADPMVRLQVDRREVRVVETLVKAIGALQTLDSMPSLGRAALKASSDPLLGLSTADHSKYMADKNLVNGEAAPGSPIKGKRGDMAQMAKTATEKERAVTPPPPPSVDIHFTVKTAPSSKISDMAENTKSLETVTIEARMTPKNPPQGTEGATTEPQLPSDDWSTALGEVVGQVVLETEVDRRFFPRHEVRNLLESLSAENLPTFRIIKEVIAL